jgi:hypothetical protein
MNRYTFSDRGFTQGINTDLSVPEDTDPNLVLVLIKTGRPGLLSTFAHEVTPLPGGSPELLGSQAITHPCGQLAGLEQVWLLMAGDGLRVALSDGRVFALRLPLTPTGATLKVDLLMTAAQSVKAKALPQVPQSDKGKSCKWGTPNDLPPPGWIAD